MEGIMAYGFAMTKTEKTRKTRRVRECMQQYARMQEKEIRELFPDWFDKEGDALFSAAATLQGLIDEHNREAARRARQADAEAQLKRAGLA